MRKISVSPPITDYPIVETCDYLLLGSEISIAVNLVIMTDMATAAISYSQCMTAFTSPLCKVCFVAGKTSGTKKKEEKRLN